MLAAACEASTSLACSWVAEFRDAGRPSIPPGRWLTVGRSFTFERVGDLDPREGFLVLHVGRSGQGVGLLGHDPEPENPSERADAIAYVAALEAKEAPPDNGFTRYLAQQRERLVPAGISEQGASAGHVVNEEEWHLTLRQSGDAYYALVLLIGKKEGRLAVFVIAKLPTVAGTPVGSSSADRLRPVEEGR